MDGKPVVSVCMITYKHEPFVGDAIKGVLMQEVDFPMELIVSDDCSPDKTGGIVDFYIKNHVKGGIIKYIKHPKNMGMVPNFYWTIDQAKGEFLALCEGDDYWSDPFKLQKQISSLRNDPTLIGSFHDVSVKIKGNFFSFHEYYNRKKEHHKFRFNFTDFINTEWLVPTCSIVFRRDKLNYPKFFTEIPVGDGPLLFLLFAQGDFYLTTGELAFYRTDNPNSAMNTYSMMESTVINSYVIKILSWLIQSGYSINVDDLVFEINKRNEQILDKVIWLQRSIKKKSHMWKILNFWK